MKVRYLWESYSWSERALEFGDTVFGPARSRLTVTDVNHNPVHTFSDVDLDRARTDLAIAMVPEMAMLAGMAPLSVQPVLAAELRNMARSDFSPNGKALLPIVEAKAHAAGVPVGAHGETIARAIGRLGCPSSAFDLEDAVMSVARLIGALHDGRMIPSPYVRVVNTPTSLEIRRHIDMAKTALWARVAPEVWP